MSLAHAADPRDPQDDEQPRMRAAVGSHRIEEEMFGRAFDGRVVRRIWEFVRPYRRQAAISVAAVTEGAPKLVTSPAVEMRPIDPPMLLTNHIAPSEPGAIRKGR